MSTFPYHIVLSFLYFTYVATILNLCHKYKINALYYVIPFIIIMSLEALARSICL